MLVQSEWACSHWLATVLDHSDLDHSCPDYDSKEEIVVEETSKYVVLFGAKLSRVNLVENLHENEGIEQDCVVLSFLGRDHTKKRISNKKWCLLKVCEPKKSLSIEQKHY